MKNEIIKFYDVQLIGLCEDDEVYIPVRPICDGIGVHTDKQILRIKEDAVLARVHAIRHIHDASGRLQEMFCLPLRYVHGWLFSIDTGKVKPEVRQRLTLFKQECYAVLFEHFFGNAKRLRADAERENYLLGRNREINRQVRDLMAEQATNKLELQSIQNRRAITYNLDPVYAGVEVELEKRKFLGQQLNIEV